MEYAPLNLKKEKVLWIVLILSIFLLNETPRMLLIYKLSNNQSNIWYINFLFIMSVTLLFIYYMKREKINLKTIFLIIIIMGLLFANSLFGNINTNSFLLFFITNAFPLMLIAYELDSINTITEIFLKIFNFIIILLTIYGIIDYLTKGALQLFIADNLAYGELQLLINSEHGYIYRMYSFFGHPLHNAELYIIFYTTNKVYNRFHKNYYNDYILLIITSIGLILSGSKTALVIGCFLFIFCSGIKKHKFLYLIFFMITISILFSSSIFKNNLFERFQIGIETNDISSGRNDVLKEVIRLGIKPNWITSAGAGNSRNITVNAMTGAENFEYPPIMLAYDYGIIETGLIYALIFLYPFITFFRNKHWFILFNYLGLFIYANSNNGLANLGTDSMAILCFIIMLFINLSNQQKLSLHMQNKGV